MINADKPHKNVTQCKWLSHFAAANFKAVIQWHIYMQIEDIQTFCLTVGTCKQPILFAVI